ncbi:MAG TPA: hypothetical protein VJP89_17375 [Pyrinomonadaceae bacterium]|nr:hypothetical protein [Pyrinomonadaceae bacterium]
MTPQQPYFPPPMHGLQTIWRDKSTLVMTKEALLPNRCIKCNEPTGERLKRKLTWHHPALYLTILISILVYAVIAMVLRKTATVNVGFCENHRDARRRHLAITWALGIVGLLCFPMAAMLEDATPVAIGGLLLLVCMIYGIVTLRVVVPTKIDTHFVYLKGIHSDYLQEFPQWQGRV